MFDSSRVVYVQFGPIAACPRRVYLPVGARLAGDSAPGVPV